MLEQRQQLRRRQRASRRFRDEPGEYAGRRIGNRVAACIIGHDVPPPQHHGDPSRQRAVRRHQRSRAVRFGLSLTQHDRDGERLFFRIGGRNDRYAGKRRRDRGADLIEPGAPFVGRGRRTQRFAQERLAAVG